MSDAREALAKELYEPDFREWEKQPEALKDEYRMTADRILAALAAAGLAVGPSGLNIEALAEAWASIDGKAEKFAAGKAGDDWPGGYYAGYIEDAKELAKRYAQRIASEAAAPQSESDV